MRKIKNAVKKLFPGLKPIIRWAKIHIMKFRQTESVFTKIYKKNEWGDTESDSGPGSNLSQSSQIREALPAILSELGASSILDIPCGDFWWMKEVNLNIDNYIGADVVKELIESNVSKYGNSITTFVRLDITKDILPKVDLVLCRDLLVHFTYRDLFLAIKNLKKSNSKYILTTTFDNVDRNEDILTGEWRSIDLTKPPFNFPKPVKMIDESNNSINLGKCLGLWRISDL